MPLTAKQQRFCEEYLVDLNATQAAIRAGYSQKTAKEIGSENLSKPNIQEFIRQKRDELSKQTGLTEEWVLKRYEHLADYDIRDFFDKNGSMIPIQKLDERSAMAISGFEVQEITEGRGRGKKTVGVVKKVKLTNRIGSLDSIRDTLGYKAPTKMDHTTKGESLNAAFYDFLKATTHDGGSDSGGNKG